MLGSENKNSILIPSQLPAFIREEPAYANFVLFLKSYYEWMEQEGQVNNISKKLLDYNDIDKTTQEFVDYFYEEFLSYFPKNIVADKVKIAKVARELYNSKGTEDSYRFLFKVLFDTDTSFFYTKDSVLKASAGKWYIAKSLRLATTDARFLNINNLKLFGETTKSIATVENAIYSGNKVEIFLSDVQRLFQSGEFVHVIDSNNQDVLFDGELLRAKVVGQINQVNISPQSRGLFYRPGDPVIVHGGLNSNTGYGASAIVNSTTAGSIQRIQVTSGGYGYRNNPNTFISITGAPGAIAVVSTLNPAANSIANVSFIPTDTIGLKHTVQIGDASNLIDYNFVANTSANWSTKLYDAFSFTSFTTYPLSSISVQNGGGGITQLPDVVATSTYETDSDSQPNLKSLGILAPIQILDGGTDYTVNDKIILTGGRGYGAEAKVTAVDPFGKITAVSYVHPISNPYLPLGGLGYTNDSLPSITIDALDIAAEGAQLYIPGILGTGATFAPQVDRIGSITSIKITDPGEDYISAPTVTLKVQDMIVNNFASSVLPQKGDIVYQGSDLANSTYRSTFDSLTLFVPNGEPLNQLYNLRVYDYDPLPTYGQPLKIISGNTVLSMTLSNEYSTINDRYNSDGVLTYGDGTAKASATFLGGLIVSSGEYLDSTGHPDSFGVLQSSVYNNYTYEITLQKEIEKYRKVLLELLHPTGMKVIGRYAMNSSNETDFNEENAYNNGRTLAYYTGTSSSYGEISGDFQNPSNNIIRFYNYASANLKNFMFENDIVRLTTSNGQSIVSQVADVRPIYRNTLNLESNDLMLGNTTLDLLTSNYFVDWNAESEITDVILRDNIWVTFANVAYVTGNSGSNVININTVTDAYDIVNNGKYSNTMYPMMDILYAGDKILVANNEVKVVANVDYIHNIVHLTTNLSNTVNSLMSVNRTTIASNIQIFGPVGTQYFPEITDQLGNTIVTEDGKLILLG